MIKKASWLKLSLITSSSIPIVFSQGRGRILEPRFELGFGTRVRGQVLGQGGPSWVRDGGRIGIQNRVGVWIRDRGREPWSGFRTGVKVGILDRDWDHDSELGSMLGFGIGVEIQDMGRVQGLDSGPGPGFGASVGLGFEMGVEIGFQYSGRLLESRSG
ncbi:hypothetical protein TIFTF001_012556 [Ficus carica]|uniref:Uncharacterized protein n=1 Tax=Ficus carica TaxID=3494 RepID=A0AA88ACI3_FICCA|nr:hypothetical protein TIFTF001_012556 [Ficus carica]